MQILAQNFADHPTIPRSRTELICAAFDFGVPSFLSLECCLDAVERTEWRGLWW